ncbi:cation diffusion facilitator family transporter [Bacillus sp. OV166]|uniref:cation diffusion facilitator family transporter n=1 Tax=Bacillus sp. OV166 TaxID=1882763 RepID=UPI0015C51F1B|nr:cation diffusion facilitator family transporter [Bacillus sp. OV166]
MINGITALLFMSGRKNDLNIRGAFMHMAADALVSLGVEIAGFIILWTGWQRLDPLVSLLISIVILFGTWGLLKESINLSLDAVPEGIDTNKIKDYLSGLPTILEVHDLHVWGMSSTGVEIAFNRALLRVSSHALFGVIMGFYMSKEKFTPGTKIFWMVLSLLIPSVLHGIFNYLMLNEELWVIIIPFMIFLWSLGMKTVQTAESLSKKLLINSTVYKAYFKLKRIANFCGKILIIT